MSAGQCVFKMSATFPAASNASRGCKKSLPPHISCINDFQFLIYHEKLKIQRRISERFAIHYLPAETGIIFQISN